MAFFDALRRVLGKAPEAAVPEVVAAEGPKAVPGAGEAGAEDVGHGRDRWHQRLKRVMDELPASRHEWAGLAADARALDLDRDWVTQCQVDEFLMLVRRAVADRLFTEAEHRKLDLARELIGIPEAEAEAALYEIVAEAESFFGGPVEGA